MPYIFTNGCGYRSFNIPSQSKNASMKSLAQYPMSFSEFTKGNALTVKFYNVVVSFVSVLCGCCNPSAVFGGISGIIIDSINRVFLGWLFSHIFEEVNESVFSLPSVTYPDTTIMVIKLFPCSVSFIATFKHVNPCIVLRTTSHAVSAVFLANKLFFLASAGNYLSISKIAVLNCLCVSAIAQAMPVALCSDARSF